MNKIILNKKIPRFSWFFFVAFVPGDFTGKIIKNKHI